MGDVAKGIKSFKKGMSDESDQSNEKTSKLDCVKKNVNKIIGLENSGNTPIEIFFLLRDNLLPLYLSIV